MCETNSTDDNSLAARVKKLEDLVATLQSENKARKVETDNLNNQTAQIGQQFINNGVAWDNMIKRLEKLETFH